VQDKRKLCVKKKKNNFEQIALLYVFALVGVGVVVCVGNHLFCVGFPASSK
jgi:hypothetical protein